MAARGRYEVMPAGLKRAAKIQTPPAVREESAAKRGVLVRELADGAGGTAVAGACTAAAGRCGLAVA